MVLDSSNSNGRVPVTPTVLLTDTIRWVGTARLAIGLKKAGMNVAVACQVQGHPVLKTSAVRQVLPYSGLRPLSSLMAAIETARPQIIIPCALGAPESYPIVSSRQGLLKVAREEGLRVPDTSLIEGLDDLDRCLAGHALPCVLKADGTWGGSGVKIAHSVEQAKQCFLEVADFFGAERAIKQLIVYRDSFWLRPWWKRLKPAVIVQSYIDGRPANCAVVCWKGKILAGIGVEVVSTEGSTGPATVVRVVDNPEMMHSAKRIAHKLNLSGFFGLDFIIEKESGATFLIEMNPRCTPVCHLQLGRGRDMIGALCAQLSGQPFREAPSMTQNDMIAYFPQAWQCKSKFLKSSFLDVPLEEPALVSELLRPWPDLGVVARMFHLLRNKTCTENSCGTTR